MHEGETMSTTITRRAMLGAALALAAPTAALGPSTAAVDPIFEAVENHRPLQTHFWLQRTIAQTSIAPQPPPAPR